MTAKKKCTEKPTVSRSGFWLSSAEFLLTWFSLVSVTAECVSVISVVRTTELLVVPLLSHSETSYTCFINFDFEKTLVKV